MPSGRLRGRRWRLSVDGSAAGRGPVYGREVTPHPAGVQSNRLQVVALVARAVEVVEVDAVGDVERHRDVAGVGALDVAERRVGATAGDSGARAQSRPGWSRSRRRAGGRSSLTFQQRRQPDLWARRRARGVALADPEVAVSAACNPGAILDDVGDQPRHDLAVDAPSSSRSVSSVAPNCQTSLGDREPGGARQPLDLGALRASSRSRSDRARSRSRASVGGRSPPRATDSGRSRRARPTR